MAFDGMHLVTHEWYGCCCSGVCSFVPLQNGTTHMSQPRACGCEPLGGMAAADVGVDAHVSRRCGEVVSCRVACVSCIITLIFVS